MVPVEQITMDRLTRWAGRLCDAHATPLVLVAIGHDHACGQLVILTVDEPEMSAQMLRAVLRRALNQLGGT